MATAWEGVKWGKTEGLQWGECRMCVKQILKELAIKGKVIKQGKFSLSYLAMLSPLKNRAISWSEDCHGKPLARITVSLSTVSDLLLHRRKKEDKVLIQVFQYFTKLQIESNWVVNWEHIFYWDSPTSIIPFNKEREDNLNNSFISTTLKMHSVVTTLQFFKNTGKLPQYNVIRN